MSGHDDPSDSARLRQLLLGVVSTHVIAAGAALRIADHFKDAARTADEIAAAAGTEPDATYRLLRALGSLGLLREEAGRVFSLTAIGQYLRSDVPSSLSATARYMAEGWYTAAWSKLKDSVRGDGNAFELAHGQAFFDWMGGHPGPWAGFVQHFQSVARLNVGAIVAALDISPGARIVDIGGGQGELLAAVLQAHQDATGVLFDRAFMVKAASKTIAAQGLDGRCELVPGDFFEAVPAGCDHYLIKKVIHDWDDERAAVIFRNIARAMPPNGRLAIIEMVVPPPGVPHAAKLLDLEMFVLVPGARERTEEEYRALLAGAGLKLTRVTPADSLLSVLEARPA